MYDMIPEQIKEKIILNEIKLHHITSWRKAVFYDWNTVYEASENWIESYIKLHSSRTPFEEYSKWNIIHTEAHEILVQMVYFMDAQWINLKEW